MQITRFSTTTLPGLRRAVADAAKFIAERDDSERFSPAWVTANTGYQDACWAGREAVRDELLPALLGGTWRMPGRQSRPRPFPQIQGSTAALLDHAKTYRRTGCMGPPRWGNVVLTAQPYLHPAGELNTSGLALARLFAEHDCGVWHCPTLSSWFPSKTILVIIARNIDPDMAAALGFVKLA